VQNRKGDSRPGVAGAVDQSRYVLITPKNSTEVQLP
jgi:hypothetical protein